MEEKKIEDLIEGEAQPEVSAEDRTKDFQERALKAADEMRPILEKYELAFTAEIVYEQHAITAKPVYADNKKY